MSIEFFITPYKSTEWKITSSDLKINIDEFQEKLAQVWPNAKFELSPGKSVLWSIPEDFSAGFFGGLQSNHQIVSFGPGGWEIFKDFILWYRSFVPSEYRLFFFNSSSLTSLELTKDLTKNAIDDFLSRSNEIEEDELEE